MTPQDLRIFCTALGFTATVLSSSPAAADDTQRAVGFADLIESFCHYVIPDLHAAGKNAAWHIDESIERIKGELRTHGVVDMEKDRTLLLQLYERLRYRYGSYASDNMIADRVLELLDAEIYHDEHGVALF